MHLHAWDTPPIQPLTDDDVAHQPYLFEYPHAVMRQKVTVVTNLLEDTYNVKMTSHRAGRFGFNSVYAQILAEQGYLVDCSVTPHKSWRSYRGAPEGTGGADFTGFPEHAYYVDLADIRKPGSSNLLEVPLTVMKPTRWIAQGLHRLVRNGPRICKAVVNRFSPPLLQLRPQQDNLKEMLRIVTRAVAEKRTYLEFMLHSSEFMPGGSPTFGTTRDIDLLYENLAALFFAATTCGFTGATLAEFGKAFTAANMPAVA
jgi:hypothetical protein